MSNLSSAWNEGFNARMRGANPVGANPYPYLSDEFDEFWYGWYRAANILSGFHSLQTHEGVPFDGDEGIAS